MPADVLIGGTTLHVLRRSDVAVARRVAAHFQRRIAEDDWRPYRSRAEAVRAWTRLGGIRLQVMEALGLLSESMSSAATAAPGPHGPAGCGRWTEEARDAIWGRRCTQPGPAGMACGE